MAQPQTALIVDDNQELADSLALALRRAGFVARTAHNGLHGYSCYFRDPTDWVVTDVDMPELNGIDMMRSIRTINSSVKTIYMTGLVEKHRRSLAQESRAFGARVLLKPFTLHQLIEQMRGADHKPPSEVSVLSKGLHNCTELPAVNTAGVAKK